MTQLGQLYRETVDKLLKAGIEDAHIDAVHLIEFCLGLTRTELFLHPEREVNKHQTSLMEEALRRRLAREPLQYIIGVREFWSLDFYVSPAVLIPRPETEFLIDRVLSVLRRSGFNNGPILDMCTGSGIIAIILARELATKKVFAVDLSIAALQIAALNIQKHKQKESISLVCSDLFGGLKADVQFELIIANPPYIASGDFESLQAEVRDWEPKLALLAGDEGLDFIERLAGEGHKYLMPGGWMFIEIGAAQKDDAYSFFTRQANAVYECVEISTDWSGKPRILQARKKAGHNGQDYY